MMNLPIYDRGGNEVGKYEIDPAQLAPRISKQLLHDAVVMYQTNLPPGHLADEKPLGSRRHDEERCIGKRGRELRGPARGEAASAAAAATSTPSAPAIGPIV